MRFLATLLSVSLAAPSAWAAPTAKAVSVNASGVGVQAVPAITIGSPGLQTGVPSLAVPSLSGSLPTIQALSIPTNAAAPVAQAHAVTEKTAQPSKHANAASPDSAPTPRRSALRMVADAIGGVAKAAKKLPGLAALGAKVAAPSADANSADAHSDAARFFNLKAGFGDHRDVEAALDAVEAAETSARGPTDFLPLAAAGKRGRGRAVAGRESSREKPKYSARRVKFNGKTFPSVAFRPDRPVADHLIEAIDLAETSITLAVYEFKNRDVLNALRRARDRGVAVKVLVDFKNAYPFKRDDADYWPKRSIELQSLTMERGFEVQVVRGLWKWGIMHNKVGVFDEKFAFFGSYNLSRYAEHNHFENINFVDDAPRVEALMALQAHLEDVAVPFKDALEHDWEAETTPMPDIPAPAVRFNGVEFPEWVFTPGTQAEDVVVESIEAAKKSVDISMFTFSSPRIAKAILAAHKRGLKVRLLFDESQSNASFQEPFVHWFAQQGIAVKTLAGPNPNGPWYAEKNHNKFMVLDGKLVLTGSFNYTTSAVHTNYENLFLMNQRTDAKAYREYFADMFAMKRATVVVPKPEPVELPDAEELVEGLRGPPQPVPAAPVWDKLPTPRTIKFNGEKFPSSLVRPQNQVAEQLIKAIDSSKDSIDLALYEFNLEPLMEALHRARARGVKIRAVIDYSHMFPKGTRSDGDPSRMADNIQQLLDGDFEVKALRGVRSQGIMHQKVAIFDGKMINFGSYNWAKSADQSHFESMMFEDKKSRVKSYKEMYEWMWDYSVVFEKAEEHKWARERPEHAPIDTKTPIEHNGEKFAEQMFSPEGMIEDAILRAIRAADTSIDIVMFSFYSARIAEELMIAKNRGIEVRLVLDSMQSKLMKLDNWFAYYGFDVKIVSGPNPFGNVFWEKNHNKYMIVDSKLMLFGSYNYTKNAEINSYENVNIYHDDVDVAFFLAFFNMLHRTGWKPLTPKAPPEGLPTPEDFFSQERLESLLADSAEF